MSAEWCTYCGNPPPCLRAECTLESKADALYPGLGNRAMARKLASGDAVDLAVAGVVIAGSDERPTLFQLPVYFPNLDYCHAPTEAWVWSIGRELRSGRVLAAFDGRFYQSPEFECLWLR
jgi:hypothetical protein